MDLKERLFEILMESPALREILTKSQSLGLRDYYVGAGAICQTVWNSQGGLSPLHGISDVDFVYFDDSDLSWEAEDAVVRRVDARFSHLPLRLDVKNQARVHLWYKSRFGADITPYPSLERAIDTWPTTATAVGARMEGDAFVVYAPFGLEDLFNRTIRANKAQITPEIYRAKCEKWLVRWPTLNVIEW